MPEAGRVYTQVLFLVQPGWYLPPQKIPLAENRFHQASKGAENTKEKSRQCFMHGERMVISKSMKALHFGV